MEKAAWRFKNKKDYEKVVIELKKLPKDILVNYVITGEKQFNKHYRNNDSVHDYIVGIKTELLFKKQNLLLEKMNKNIEDGEKLKSDPVKWRINMNDFMKITEDMDKISKKIETLRESKE